jgi:hypothetical protein
VTVAKGYSPCPGNSAAGALELATGGDWSGTAFSFGQAVDVIKGESHAFGSGAFWGFDVNGVAASTGVCDPSYVPAEGDEILFYPACESADLPTCFSGDPLDLTAPRTVAPGVPFTVRVDEFTGAAKAASAGASVAGATTGADGTASLTLGDRGPATVVATKGDRVRDEADVCVTDGADGFCGTPKPGTAAPLPAPAPAPCATNGHDGLCGTPDKTPAFAAITGIREQQRFRRSRAPRELTATVAADQAGLRAVKLGLSRAYKGRCWVLSGKRERFRRSRCGHHATFTVGTRADVSYLLASRLRPGRYVLDVVAIDGAGNRDPLARGRNRIVFTVT